MMRATGVVALLTALLMASPASADLSSATYVAAKAAYNKGDLASAKTLLVKYQKEDAAFLQANTPIAKAVQDAIDYCSTLAGLSHMIIAANVVLPPKPVLK